MFKGLKNLLLVGILFYGINVGFAQEKVELAQEKLLGQAYEFSGLTRFVIAPSQILFGNDVWDKATIVYGYDVQSLNKCIDELTDSNYKVLSQEDNTEWWNQPIYNINEIPKKKLDIINDNNNEVFILVSEENLSQCQADDIINKKFVVNIDKLLK
ncbi:MAG: hypothetical protein OXC02_09775 [Rhodobacteraceae bacterium]|nr:hypothetical protein [Paracoccaceae bacterium]